jgi:hypothetical protein
MRKMNIITIIGISLIFLGGMGGIILAIGQARSANEDKQEIITTTKDENKELKSQIQELKGEREKLNKLLEIRDKKIGDQNQKIESLSNQLIEKSDFIQKYISGGDSYPCVDINGIPDEKGENKAITFSVVNTFELPIYDITIEAWDNELILFRTSHTPEGSFIKREDFNNSKLFVFEKKLLSPSSIDLYPGSHPLRPYQIYMRIHTRNKSLIQKASIIEHSGRFFAAYQIFSYPDMKLIKEHFYTTSDAIKQDLKVQLDEIPNLMKQKIIN